MCHYNDVPFVILYIMMAPNKHIIIVLSCIKVLNNVFLGLLSMQSSRIQLFEKKLLTMSLVGAYHYLFHCHHCLLHKYIFLTWLWLPLYIPFLFSENILVIQELTFTRMHLVYTISICGVKSLLKLKNINIVTEMLYTLCFPLNKFFPELDAMFAEGAYFDGWTKFCVIIISLHV